ncbi:MAG: ArsA-related P-loop ATPase [Anaeromyxobacteraceae bacterium]
MAAPDPLDRRLLVVTGKGGVGKSTVAAALALRAARAGKKVLVCEADAQERIAPLLGARPSGPIAREVRPGLHTVNVQPPAAMREYGVMVLRFRAIYDAVFENRVMRYFLRAVPGLAELVILGKVLYEAKVRDRTPRGEAAKLRWDLVILDAPATGHAVQLLRVPQALLATVPAGPLHSDAQWMRAMLTDPAHTGIVVVTLPEEMPVNEAIDLDHELAALELPRAALVVNAMPATRFTPAERERLSPLEAAPPPVGPAARAAVLQALRAEIAGRELARARETLALPTYVLPLLGLSTWGPEAVDRVAGELGKGAAP